MKVAFRICFPLCLLFMSIKSQIIQILHKNIHYGDTVMLLCIPPNNQDTRDETEFVWWSSKNEQIMNSENYVQNGKQLLIKNISRETSGYYRCEIEYKLSGAKVESPRKLVKPIDSIEKNSHHDKLDSLHKFQTQKLGRKKRNKNADDRLKFTPKPTSKNFELGSSGKIHCRAAGSQKIWWTKDSDELLPNDVEDVNGTLIFNNVVLDHKGTYTCTASSDEEIIKALIEVGIMPQFELPPEDLEVVEMQTVLLNCVGIGDPKPTVKWDYETKLIDTENDERFQIYDNGSLLLHEARQDDSGRYGCTIGNSAGFKRSESSLVIKQMDSHSSFEDSEDESSFFMSKAVIMTCLVAFIYMSLVVALMFWCRHKRQKSRNSEDPEMKGENDDTASDVDEKEPLNHENKVSRNKVHHNSEKQKKIKSSPSCTLIIDHLMIGYDKLIDLKKIGRGEFGEVLVGTINETDLPAFKRSDVKENGTDEIQKQENIKLLVKSMSKNKDESYFVEYRRQIDLYRAIDSQNVVKLLALCYEKDHHFMILEHSQELKAHLIENPQLSFEHLSKYCCDIARGLEAIAKSKLTHRDIALNNCIISKDTIKLSSTALHNTTEYYKFNHRLIRIRHLAPEVLDNFVYSTHSDIYACGITMWQVITKGIAVPFEAISNEEFFQSLQTKSIDHAPLLKHNDVPIIMQNILQKCWCVVPNDRITPQDLTKSFVDELIKNKNGDIN